VLKDILESLRITEEYTLDRNRTMEITLEKMSTAPAPVVHNKTVQIIMLKNMIPDLE